MKKNIFMLITLVCVSFLFFSCTKEDYAFTASARDYYFEGYIYSMYENGRLTYRKANSTEENILCFDPLCSHGMDCPAYIWGRIPEMIVARNRDNEVCVYYTDEVFSYEDNKQDEYFLYCINTSDGTKTAVLPGLADAINGFWLYGNDIYMVLQSAVMDEGGSIVGYGTNFYRVHTDGSELTKLTDFEEQSVNIAAITEVKGETVVYWIDYYDNRTLYVSPTDFSEKTKLTDNVPLFGNFVVGNTLYYSTDSSIVAPALVTEAYPSDKDKNEDGTRTIYREKTLSAYYKLDLTNPDAESELVYDGVSAPNMRETPLWTDGDKLYIIPYDPVFYEVIAADLEGTLTGDIVIDSLLKGIQIDYIAFYSGAKIIEMDLTSGEKREIATPGFDPHKIIGGGNGKLVLNGDVVDGDRIRAKLEEEGVRSSSFAFSEIQVIDISEQGGKS